MLQTWEKRKRENYDKCTSQKDRNVNVPSKRLWVLNCVRDTLKRLSFSFWLAPQNCSISVTWFSITTADVFDLLDIRLKLLSKLFHSFISPSPLNVPFRAMKRVSNFPAPLSPHRTLHTPSSSLSLCRVAAGL